jgi:peptide/nickel transport system permease protein
MLRFVAIRLGHAIFVLWGVITAIFLIVRVVPGDPVTVLLGPNATTEQLDAARADLGLDDPLWTQYVDYMKGVIQLDFGESYRLGGSAVEHVIERLPATIRLAVTSIVLAVVIGFPLGIAAARRAGRISDRVITGTSLIGQSLPQFWVGIVLILVFSRTLKWLPSAGDDGWKSYIMPSITLALPFLSLLVRLVRSGLLDVLGSDFIRTARAKGLREGRVTYEHGVPNMLIPVVTVVGLQLGLLVGGAVIVETVFAWPGIGRLLVTAIFNRDFNVVQAAVAFIAFGFILINLIVDISYGYLDPRLRIGSGER